MANLHTPILKKLFRKQMEEESPGEGVVDRIEGDVAVLETPEGEKTVPGQYLTEGQEIDPLTRAVADMPDQAPKREGIKVLESPSLAKLEGRDTQELAPTAGGGEARAIKTYTGPEAPETEPTMAEARQAAASKATFDWDSPHSWGGGGGYNFEYTPQEGAPGTITVTRPGYDFEPRVYDPSDPKAHDVYGAILGEYFRGDTGEVHAAPEPAPEAAIEARPEDVGESLPEPGPDTRTSERPDEERDLVGESIAQAQPPVSEVGEYEHLPEREQRRLESVQRTNQQLERLKTGLAEFPGKFVESAREARKTQEAARARAREESPAPWRGWMTRTPRTARATDRARAAAVAAASEEPPGESRDPFEAERVDADAREQRASLQSEQPVPEMEEVSQAPYEPPKESFDPFEAERADADAREQRASLQSEQPVPEMEEVSQVPYEPPGESPMSPEYRARAAQKAYQKMVQGMVDADAREQRASLQSEQPVPEMEETSQAPYEPPGESRDPFEAERVAAEVDRFEEQPPATPLPSLDTEERRETYRDMRALSTSPAMDELLNVLWGTEWLHPVEGLGRHVLGPNPAWVREATAKLTAEETAGVNQLMPRYFAILQEHAN